MKEANVRCKLCKVKLGYSSFKNHWERIHKKTLQEKDPDIEWDASFRKKYTTPIKDASTLKKLQTSVAHLTGVVNAIAIHLNVAISAVDELEEYVKALEILWGLHKANPSLASVINHHPRGPAVSAYLDMHKRRTVALSKDLAVDHNAERGRLAPPPAPAPDPAAKEKRKRVHLEPSLKETGVRCKLCGMKLGYGSFKTHWVRLHKKTLQETNPGIEWDASFHKVYSTPLKATSTLKKLQSV